MIKSKLKKKEPQVKVRDKSPKNIEDCTKTLPIKQPLRVSTKDPLNLNIKEAIQDLNHLSITKDQTSINNINIHSKHVETSEDSKNVTLASTSKLNTMPTDLNNSHSLITSSEYEDKEYDVSKPLDTLPSAPEMPETYFTSNPQFQVRQRCLEHFYENQETSQIPTHADFLAIKPYSEIQLLALYNNFLLDEKESIITNFLEHEKHITQNIFYEIVLNYLKARANLLATEKHIKTLMDQYNKQKEEIWVFEERTIIEDGICEDEQHVSVKCNHEIASYQPKVVKHLSTQLKQMREALFESHSLFLYTSEMSKLQVENYLQKVMSGPEFTSLAKFSQPVCHFFENKEPLLSRVNHLKDCISILMSFMRRNIQDLTFIREIKSWLSDLVAILLRVGTYKDHLFILNHLMRCPAGVGDWGSSFIQILPPSVSADADLFGSPLLDHMLTMLSVLLHSTQHRKDFLCHFKGNANEFEFDHTDASWIVVDSSGEDEEDSNELWHYFSENDIIQLMNQIPFEAMFKYILLIETHGEELDYQVGKATHHSIMKLFAFCTCLLKILQTGLSTYCQTRFKGVVKRLIRLIRHTVNYVTDHLKGFFDCIKEETTTSVEDNAMAIRLQVEYDQFFENAVKIVFQSPRCGAWQFLAVVPYSCVSLLRLWKIAYKLHVGFSDQQSTEEFQEEDWLSLLKSEDTKGRFHDRLSLLDDSETYYLLTALANMAIVRPKKEKIFINVIVSNLFDATLVNEDLHPKLSRIGRDLFLTITAAHPFTISTLLSELQEKLIAIGSLSLYLFRFLSLDGWYPSEDDLQCLSYWLIYTPVPSLENQLARIIIAKMNWHFSSRQNNALALPRSIHERVALLVVEVAVKLQSKMIQGGFLSEGMKQVTSAVYAPSPEQVLMRWCWKILNLLHLHHLDQPTSEIQAVILNPSLILRGIGDPSSSPQFETLKKGINSKQPSLSMFTALLMSSWGHSIPEICNHAPECLEIIVSNGHIESALTILSLITPLFFAQKEELISDSKFINALQCILMSDQKFVNIAKNYISSDTKHSGLSLFKGLIIDQIFHHKRFNLDDPSTIVKFWIHTLILIPSWRNNISILSLIDLLCEISLFDHVSWQSLKDVFLEQRKWFSGERSSSKGGIGSLFSWMSSASGAPPSLVIWSYSTTAPWFTLCNLICEGQDEVSSGLWRVLLTHLQHNSELSLEIALKNVCSDLEISTIPSSSLTIYRLAQLILDLPCDHPAIPPTAQIFIMFHLSRAPPSEYCQSSSVTYKFYESFINSNFLKKIKDKLSDVHAFWKNQLADEQNKERDITPDSNNSLRTAFLSKLTATLDAMNNWMEESKLYEVGLFIPALPPQLLPTKLILLFEQNWDLWPELVDGNNLEQEISRHVKCWKSHRETSSQSASLSPAFNSPTHIQFSDATESLNEVSISPSESILKRLKEYDSPKPPPPLPVISDHCSWSATTSVKKESVLYDIERFSGLILEHSRVIFMRSKEICALDCVYGELLPQLWSNPLIKKVISCKCKPTRNSKLTECSGPASIITEYCEKRLNAVINSRIQQNRDHHLDLINQSLQSPPLQVCKAAIQLDELVNLIVSWYKKEPLTKDEQNALLQYGRDLFYHFVHLTSEETQVYPPARLLITSCSEILGQEFLHGYKDCQESLASLVLQSNAQFGLLLSPHFTPLVTSMEVFLSIYSSICSHVAAQTDLCFTLLSKFEVEAWLRERRLSSSEWSQLINCVFSSFNTILALGNEETLTCLELYRVHLKVLFNFSFPENLNEVLILLMDSSVSTLDCGDVRRSVWYDLLNTLAYGVTQFASQMDEKEELEAIRRYARLQVLLSPEMVKDTIDCLSSHLIRQRLEFGFYGLYYKYKSGTEPATTLVAMLTCSYMVTTLMAIPPEGSDACRQDVWNTLKGIWGAWVSPLGGSTRNTCPKWVQELTLDKSVLLPWIPGDLSGPTLAVGKFTSTLAFFHSFFEAGEVLSLFLHYYQQTYASPSVKDHILAVIHMKMSALPWHHLAPSLKDLETFSKIINEYLPECHSFIGKVFIQIPWSEVVQNHSDHKTSEASPISPTSQSISLSPLNVQDSVSPSIRVKFHLLFLNILVRISMEPTVRQGSLVPFLERAASFHWHLIDAKNLEATLNWFVMSCDPRIVLHMDTRNPIDIALLNILHLAAGFSLEKDLSLHRSGSLKRRFLVRTLCRLLTTSATRHKALLTARSSLFEDTYSSLLSQMEEIVIEGLPEASQTEEGVMLSAEAVYLIGGGASPAALQDVCRDALLNWLEGTHQSRRFLLPLATSISKGVLHLRHRSSLLNECILAILNHADAVGERESLSWSDVVRVLSFPVTNPMPMLTFAAQENHLLVIYAHTKWRLHSREVAVKELLFILSNIMELLALITPNERAEASLMLILGEVIDIIENELRKGEEYENIWRHTTSLTQLLSLWADDKSFSNILAAIGLYSKQSSLSPRCRLICKSLATFFRSQMLSPGYFCILNEHKRTLTETDEVDTTSDSPTKSFHQLLSLRTNTAYSSYQNALTFAIEFIQDCHFSMLDTHSLFDGLLARLFSPGSAILQLRRNILADPPSLNCPSTIKMDLNDDSSQRENSEPSAPPASLEEVNENPRVKLN